MSDEKYVALTEALEWEKRVRAEMTEDERVMALENALHVVNEAAAGWDGLEYESNMGRALLEAARWFREHQNVAAGMLWCIKCNPKRRGIDHDPECTVGRWVRAAERAGL